MGLVAARLRFHLDQAGEAHLGEDLIAGGRGSLQGGEEVALGGGEESQDALVGRARIRLGGGMQLLREVAAHPLGDFRPRT